MPVMELCQRHEPAFGPRQTGLAIIKPKAHIVL
jgi:hypothetical protein